MRHAVKKRLIVLVVLSCSCGLAYFAASHIKGRVYTSNDVGPRILDSAKVAVLDGERLKQAKCFRSNEKISGMLADVLANIRKSESEIREQHNSLRNDKKLSQKQRAKDVSRLEAKWSKMSERYNLEIQRIKEKDSALNKLIQRKMGRVIETIARETGLSVVVSKVANDSLVVFYNTKNVDITDEVIRRLDEELPNIDLESLESN
jgi:Skp family chaperone for outer membrane proteins